MTKAIVILKDTGEKFVFNTSNITLSAQSTVLLHLNPEQISSSSRQGDDLIIVTVTGDHITIKNFYVSAHGGGHSNLVLEDNHGVLWWLDNSANNTHFSQVVSIDAIPSTIDSVSSDVALIAGATLLGVGAMLLGDSHHHSDNDHVDSSLQSEPSVSASDIHIFDMNGKNIVNKTSNDATPILKGTAGAGDTVSILDNG
ncbi:BapA prefix-like domain-containing protein, partial [Tatumella sp. JGM130]|uniref:BapA/Bap/LapF family prefix-like domain-containing protein n=1 Tax=Tatumella sp. JGM130 TaxID=2799797 RepID=UPI001BAEC920